MITGTQKLAYQLEDIGNIDLVPAVEKAILLVQSEAKSLVPASSGELRSSILTTTEYAEEETVRGTCYTNAPHAIYVEFGTGPKGSESHEGISPDIAVSYSMEAWWIHEGPGENEVDRETGEKYHWPYIDTKEGRFYKCEGMAAQPYMYPALKNNEETVKKYIGDYIRSQIG